MVKKDIEHLQAIFNLFRDANKDMSITQAVVMLEVLKSGTAGVTVKSIAERLDLTVAAASRNIRALLPEHSKGRAGLDMINYEHTKEDYRVIVATPNERLKAFEKKLTKALSQAPRS